MRLLIFILTTIGIAIALVPIGLFLAGVLLPLWGAALFFIPLLMSVVLQTLGYYILKKGV